MRSAITPPISENIRIGICPRKLSRPSRKGECEISSTSQLWATICIQVPMDEVQAPSQSRRKSRYWKALKVRRNTSLRQRLFALDYMQDIAVQIGEEH